MDKKFVITIARGFGSGGKQIAREVAKALGIPCHEHDILTIAAEKSGYDRSKFAEADEKIIRHSLLHTLSESFVPNDVLFEHQAKVIRELAEKESCVIVGKCADYVLRDMDNVFSFYIEATRAVCLKNVMEKMDVTEYEANELITETDKYRADYYKYYTGGNYWTNPVNYDLTLNSGKLGLENCVKVIKNYVEMMTENENSDL